MRAAFQRSSKLDTSLEHTSGDAYSIQQKQVRNRWWAFRSLAVACKTLWPTKLARSLIA